MSIIRKDMEAYIMNNEVLEKNFCNFMKENEGTLVNMNHHIEKQEKEIDLVNLRKA